jgi:hypothetical protein
LELVQCLGLQRSLSFHYDFWILLVTIKTVVKSSSQKWGWPYVGYLQC